MASAASAAVAASAPRLEQSQLRRCAAGGRRGRGLGAVRRGPDGRALARRPARDGPARHRRARPAARRRRRLRLRGSAGSGTAGRRAFQARWSVDAALSDAWAARRAAWKRVRERGVVTRGGAGGVAAQEGRLRGGGGVGGGVGTTSAREGVGTTSAPLETRKRPRVSVAASGDAGAEVAACSGHSRCGVSARGDGNGASRDRSGSHEMRRVDRGVVVWRSRRALQRRAKAIRSAWRRRSMRPRARAWSGVTSICFASRMDSASSRSSAGRPSTKRAAPSLESASPAAAAAAQTRRRGPRSCVCRASRAAAASAPPIHASRAGGRRVAPRDRRLDGETDGLHGHEAAAVVSGDSERRELLFQGGALVNLRRTVVWGQVEHRLHEELPGQRAGPGGQRAGR